MTTEPDLDLDDLLARSAPPVSTASPAVLHEVGVVVQAARRRAPSGSAHRLRGRRRVALGAGTAAVVFLGISTAAASPSAPSWLAWANWVPDRTVVEPPGQCALLGIKVVPHRASVDDPAVVAARQYLSSLDLENVDVSEELARQRSTLGTGVGGGLFTEAELEYRAYTEAISQMIYVEVQRQGLDVEHVSIEGRADGCAPETDR